MEPVRHNWSCEETEARLCDYLDGTLEFEAQAQMESHAASCNRCASIVASVSGLVSNLHRLEPLPEPLHLSSAILQATIRPGHVKTGWRNWLGWLAPIFQPRFSYGAVSVLVTVLVVSRALGIQWRKPVLGDLKPVNLVYAANRQTHQAYARSVKFIDDLRLVYEIQTRLHPEDEPQPAEEPAKAAPGLMIAPGQKPSQQLMNRTRDRFPAMNEASFVGHALPGRNI
jgi:hypothetical protein